MGKSPNIGYGQDKKIKFVHPVGKREALVHNMAELNAVEDKVVRISATVSKRLRQKLVEEAQKKKLVVLNSGKIKKVQKPIKKAKAAPSKG